MKLMVTLALGLTMAAAPALAGGGDCKSGKPPKSGACAPASSKSSSKPASSSSAKLVMPAVMKARDKPNTK